MLKDLLKKSSFIIDVLLWPFVIPSAIVLKLVRMTGVHRLPLSRGTLWAVGVFPIRDHYYEPLFNPKHLKKPLNEERNLPGIDWNEAGQLELLKAFNYQHEFENISDKYVDDTTFSFNNGSFNSGDAEFWYSLIRLKRPKTIIEVGSGQSTKMAQLAIKKNKSEDASYTCKHICIEPYEMPWLEKLGIDVHRKKVEDVEMSFFQQLGAGDVLFIDSSHMMRPQGDVLFEYLELLPTLKPGVIVHVHDIFSPRDYLTEWVTKEVILWNEQYLLEAFLISNKDWKVIGMLNFLRHRHYPLLKEKCPRLIESREPGSFYMVRV